MSTQAQHMGSWNQPQYSFKQPLQLEEQLPYLESPSGAQRFPQQQQASQEPYNRPVPPGRFNSYTSSSPYSTSSNPGFIQQGSMPTPTFNSLSIDVTPTYNQSSLNNPEANQANYQAGQFGASLGTNRHAPGGSPSPNTTVSAPSTSHPFLAAGPMQFSYPQPPPRRQSELQTHYFSTQKAGMPQGPSSNAKRYKVTDMYEDNQAEPPDAPQEADVARPKPTGACARCKSLKVRCEFRGDSDTCRRCTSAVQECVIPGRKPRRAPPKREHLMNQIRDQANQIRELKAKVEASNRHGAPLSPSDAQSSCSPTSSMEANSEAVVPNAEMQDWIAKAQEPLQAYGGLVPPWAPMEHREDPDPSDDDITAEEYSDDQSGYATADDDVPRDMASPASSITKKQVTAKTKLNMLPADDAPYGLMASLAIKKSAREKSVEPESLEAIGVANANFFKPSSAPDPIRMNLAPTGVRLPHILARGIVTTQEVDMLYNIYFEKMNPAASLLDPALHTPQYVAMRSPFLFTIICGVASRFYTPRPDLYGQLMHYAQLAAGTALISGTKNEEMSAAYLLMQLYPVPAKRWDEERSWIYLGVAIRIAQDINLNRPITAKPLNEQNARVLLSRQRIWLNCCNLDRSTGSQYGKAPIIPNTDYFASHSEDWWRSSPYNMKGFDIHTCGYNAELRLMSDFQQKIYSDPTHPTGLNKAANFTQIASETDDALRQLGERWFRRLDEFEEEKTEVAAFRTELLKMAYAYSRLVALSTGLKHAKEDQLDENSFLMRCLGAASDIVNAFVRRLFPTPARKILLRHAPDAQFVFVTFAGAFLVKLLQPQYSQYFSYERRREIRTLVQEAVDLLGAPEVVVDDKHGPKLFSRFLAGLLASQSANADKLSPTSAKSTNGRRLSSRSKGKNKEASGSSYPSGLGSELPSPSGYSESPSPAQRTMHLDGASPGLSRGHSPSGIDTQDGSAIHTSALFQPLMPIDQELLESMQFMPDPLWQDTSVPGFQWMNQLNTSGGSALHTNDYAMYESQQYGPTPY
ncbi:hypothetical protein BS17DRAFT_121764 [Gyrodon lividus]|nr:hypothetical protein BS17DRAFT_121764 [Gyrodon lividus]